MNDRGRRLALSYRPLRGPIDANVLLVGQTLLDGCCVLNVCQPVQARPIPSERHLGLPIEFKSGDGSERFGSRVG